MTVRPLVPNGRGAARRRGEAMSDNYIRLCPTDVDWQPERDAAEVTAAYVAGLFSGPDGDVEEVGCEFYDQVTLIDAGENTECVTCPRCGVTVALSALGYDWPVGFARFEVCAMNPTRGKYELDAEELAHVASLLGHPVTQILAHY
jgi:hypothetical protein